MKALLQFFDRATIDSPNVHHFCVLLQRLVDLRALLREPLFSKVVRDEVMRSWRSGGSSGSFPHVAVAQLMAFRSTFSFFSLSVLAGSFVGV